MTHPDALQYCQSCIQFKCVSPRTVCTPLVTEVGLAKELQETAAAQAPMKRHSEAVEVASEVMFWADSEQGGVR